MPQSYTDNLQHVVFSTKDRLPLIAGEWRDEMYAYIGGIARSHQSTLLAAGGTDDHVHLLLGLHPTVAPADLIRDIKANSSRWVRQDRPRIGFRWQKGYGGFSVSRSNVDRVKRYLAGQEEHHRKMTFQEEYVALLVKHKIQFDERYLWE